MKNLYITTVLLVFSLSLHSQADLQNANWVFGDHAWLDFNNATVTAQSFLPVIAPFNREGVATLSDTEGNIVFWTNGETVNWLNGTTVTPYTGGVLYGDISSSQNVVIIPKLNHPGIFYLVTITGYTTNLPGERTGLYYSEVNTLTRTISPSTPTALLDDAGTMIDNDYGNISESITVTPALDGSYWLITHVQNSTNSSVYSYNVNENGIGIGGHLLPSFSTPLSNSTSTPSIVLKVSSDNSRIGLSRDQLNPIIGTFADGVITFNLTPIGDLTTPPGQCYGLEFAPNNSQILYFSKSGVGIIGIDLANPTNEILIDPLQPIYAIQRAINGRLYIARKGTGFVSEIGTPENLAHPNYVQAINLAGRTSSIGLPQWVWINCEPTLTLASPADDSNNLSSFFVRHLERENWISASNVIGFGDNTTQNGVVYHAGNFVDLTPGFDAILTSQFEAYPEGCSDNYVYKNGSANVSPIKDSGMLVKSFTIYPNPSNSMVELMMQNTKFIKVSINSIDGKTVFETNTQSSNNYQLDVAKYANGIYIVNILTDDGQTYSKKLIKN